MDATEYRRAERAFLDTLGLDPDETMVPLDRLGGRARVQTVGQGRPVLFVHGVSNAGASWMPLIGRLKDRFRCVVLDRPGCGLSDPLPGPLDDVAAFERYSADLVADVLDGLGIDRAPVVGTSMGGFVSIHAAAAIPERVERLALVAWSMGSPIEHTPMVLRIGSLGPIGKLMARMPVPRAAVPRMVRQIGMADAMDAGKISDEFLGWFHGCLKHTDTMRNELATMPPIMDIGGMNESILIGDEVLSSIRVPVAAFWGRSDPMGGEATARAFTDRIPGASLTMIDGGHAPWIDRPAEVADGLTEFLTN